jgi:hypothetical protein
MTTTTQKTSWRDVPVPKQIAALPKEQHGFPITYIAQRWSVLLPEDRSQFPTTKELGWVAMEDTDGEYELDLGHMSEERQRSCWLDLKCQVCEANLRKRTKYLFGGLGDRPLEDFWFREPFACHSCMGYALQVCPGILHGRKGGDSRVVRYRESVGMIVERGGVNGVFQSPIMPRFDSVALYLRVKVEGDVMTPEEFLEGWKP